MNQSPAFESRRTKGTKDSAIKAAAKTKTTTGKAAKTAKESATKSAGTVRAARAARDGRVEDARAVAAEAAEADVGDGAATKPIGELDALHYQVDVNRRGLSVSALTTTLNQRGATGGVWPTSSRSEATPCSRSRSAHHRTETGSDRGSRGRRRWRAAWVRARSKRHEQGGRGEDHSIQQPLDALLPTDVAR